MTNKPASIEQAWAEHKQQLLAFINSKVDTPEDAEDILSDVFLRLLKSTHNAPFPNTITGWLYHVTKNRIVDYYRAKKRFDQLPAELAQEASEITTITQLSHCILPLISTLPERYQRPLLLSEIDGKQYKEVAIELALSLSAVKSRILRGREKLLNSMVKCCTLHHNKAGETIDYDEKNRVVKHKNCTVSC